MLSLVSEPIENYVADHTSDVSDLLQQLEDETYRNVSMPQMLSGPVVGNFLASLVTISGASRVLEIGTFTGYATLMMADVLPEGGEIITIDSDEISTAFAKKYWAKSSSGKRIRQVIGNATNLIDEMVGSFDLIFIDADKENYPQYYEKCLGLLSPNGIMVLDNMLRSGSVVEEGNNDLIVVTLRNLANQINKDPRVVNVLLTVRDGLMLVRKKFK